MDRHLGRLGHATVEAGEQRAAAGEHDALVHDVGHQLGRRLLDGVLDRVDDLDDRRLDGLADLVGADLDAARKAGEQVAAAERDALGVPSPGYDEPIAILMSSDVRSPRNRLYSRRANVTMSWSISSPPIRIERDTTIPPSEMTATSVVPPPMSTIRLPDGSLTGRPAPIAAAMGSSMRRAQRRRS